MSQKSSSTRKPAIGQMITVTRKRFFGFLRPFTENFYFYAFLFCDVTQYISSLNSSLMLYFSIFLMVFFITFLISFFKHSVNCYHLSYRWCPGRRRFLGHPIYKNPWLLFRGLRKSVVTCRHVRALV